MIDYEVLIAKFYDIQARVNRFGAVMYPGKRHRTWRMLMEQHDAVFLEVPKKSLKRDLDVIQEIMSNPDTEGWCDVKLRVPITAEAKYGPNLGELIREETVIPEEE